MSAFAGGWEEISRLAGRAGGKAARLAALQDLREAKVLPAAWVAGPQRALLPRVLKALRGHRLLIVRSSAAAEDGAHRSLAGHFASVVCAATEQGLAQGLEQAHAESVETFASLLRRRGETEGSARRRGARSLSFLVQPALVAERSAVYFEESPLHPGRALAAGAFGSCHSVVDGTLAADTYVLDGKKAASQEVVHKFEMTWVHLGGACGQPVRTPLGPSWLHLPYGPALWSARVPRGLNDAPALEPEHLARLARLGGEVKARLGFAPDLEVSFAGEALYLLQARPITTRPPKRAVRSTGGLIIASPGVARGPVRVVPSLDEAGKVKRGEVVAVGATDPEYLPMFRRAAAVLSEEGSPLCHTAIVARELGLPCLVGVEDATRGRFADGQWVKVDAVRGRVTQVKR